MPFAKPAHLILSRMQQQEIIPHLFRTEYRKIIAVLCKHFGLEQIEIAEDIASDTFVTAAQVWSLHTVPENPVAWLYTVAKNKAKNYLQRNDLFKSKISQEIKKKAGLHYEEEPDLSIQNINDSQLQMIFAVCHPSISKEAQVGLALRILCGFGIEEIAGAFLTNRDTINKRLQRAKQKLREQKICIELPGIAELNKRLENVLTTIYLLFSEGYYSISQNTTIRKELCIEAMRLCTMLTENEYTDTSKVKALLALMCFQASRFDARIDTNGELVLYEEQDVNLWNTDLVNKGIYYLHQASQGNEISKYHLEASIAFWSTQKEDTKEKWETILQLYNRLLQIEYSPIAALNRTYALSKANSKEAAIIEAEKLKLENNQFYFALLGELYAGMDNKKAKQHFEQAYAVAKTQTDKAAMLKKIRSIS